MARNPTVLAWSILIFLALVWGSSYIMMEQGLKVFSPTEIAGLRNVIAGLCLLPFALLGYRKIHRKEWKYIVTIGVLGNALPAILFPLALTVVTTSTAGILNSLTPLFTLLLGAMLFGVPFTTRRIVGILIGFAGATLLILFKSGKPDSITGEVVEHSFWTHAAYAALVVAATVLYAISTNVMKKHLNQTSPVLVSAFALASILLPYSLYLLFTDVPRLIAEGSREMWVALGYIAVLGAIGTGFALVLFNRLIQLTDAIFSTSVTYIMPIVVLIWGFQIGEEIGPAQIGGMIIILAGVYLANKKETVRR